MIISLVNIKGGCGKTTSAMALATVAVRRGREAVVYDADPQGSASLWAMDAEEAGQPLPFEVRSANIATVRRLARTDSDALVIIDTPPTGNVTDAAVDAADFVIIPVSPSRGEIKKTEETIATVRANGCQHAVLVNRAKARTRSYRELVGSMDEREVSFFETSIPDREALRNAAGAPFGDDLYGYESVYDELMEAM